MNRGKNAGHFFAPVRLDLEAKGKMFLMFSRLVVNVAKRIQQSK